MPISICNMVLLLLFNMKIGTVPVQVSHHHFQNQSAILATLMRK